RRRQPARALRADRAPDRLRRRRCRAGGPRLRGALAGGGRQGASGRDVRDLPGVARRAHAAAASAHRNTGGRDPGPAGSSGAGAERRRRGEGLKGRCDRPARAPLAGIGGFSRALRRGRCLERASSRPSCRTMPDGLVPVVVGLPFAAAIVAGFLSTHARGAAALLAGAVAVVDVVLIWVAYPTVAGGGVLLFELEWMPALGLNFVLRMDGFAWLFAGLVAAIGALIVLYARYYMSPEDPVPRFFSFLLAFMGSMTGMVLSGNLIQLAFFWELTSLFSFLLIGYWYHTAQARDGARMALTGTAAGGLCLLAGLLLPG